MRCPSCEKFTGLETEVQSDGLEMAEDAEAKTIHITGSITVNRNCADCSGTLKSLSFDVDHEVALGDVDPETIDWTQPMEMEESAPEETESGGGRYRKNMIGFDLEVTITGKLLKAKDGEDEFEISDTIHDESQASAYEEQV